MNRFVNRLLLFCIGPVSGAVFSVITIPLLTHFLSPEELGRASMFTLVQTLIPTICLGLDQAYSREFYVEVNQKNLFLNSLFLPFVLSIILFAIFVKYSNLLSKILFDHYDYNTIIYMLGFVGITIVLERFILLKIRMEEKAFEYSIFTFSIKASVFLFIVLFIIFVRTDFLAIVYATIIGQLTIRFILFIRYIHIFNLSSFRIDKQLSKRLLLFGIPLIVSVLLGSVLKTVSNMFLRYYVDFDQLGLFSAGTKIANLLFIIHSSFTLFWKPTAYRWHEEGKKIVNFQIVSEAVLAIMFLVFILLLFLRPIITFFISDQFSEAQNLISFLSLPPIMSTLISTTKLGITFSRKSYLNILAVLVGLLVSVVLNILLVPILGALGAAISIGTSYVIYFLVSTLLSFSVWKGFNIKKHLVVICLMLILSYIDIQYPNHIIYAKIVCLVIFLIIHIRLFQIIISRSSSFRTGGKEI